MKHAWLRRIAVVHCDSDMVHSRVRVAASSRVFLRRERDAKVGRVDIARRPGKSPRVCCRTICLIKIAGCPKGRRCFIVAAYRPALDHLHGIVLDPVGALGFLFNLDNDTVDYRVSRDGKIKIRGFEIFADLVVAQINFRPVIIRALGVGGIRPAFGSDRAVIAKRISAVRPNRSGQGDLRERAEGTYKQRENPDYRRGFLDRRFSDCFAHEPRRFYL